MNEEIIEKYNLLKNKGEFVRKTCIKYNRINHESTRVNWFKKGKVPNHNISEIINDLNNELCLTTKE